MAGFGSHVGACALEIIGGVVKCIVVRVSINGADAISEGVATSDAVSYLTLFMGSTGEFRTQHLRSRYQVQKTSEEFKLLND